jgi:hypothetical protein
LARGATTDGSARHSASRALRATCGSDDGVTRAACSSSAAIARPGTKPASARAGEAGTLSCFPRIARLRGLPREVLVVESERD